MSSKSREYLKGIDKEVIEALTKIIIEENKTERLIRSSASSSFIEDLCGIIDTYSPHWNKEEK